MTQKKRLVLSASFTLLTLSLVAIKLIRWHIHEISPDLSGWAGEELVGIIVYIIPAHTTFMAAFLGIITFWLPPKPKFVFGIAALFISGPLLLWELGLFAVLLATILFGAKPGYSGFDPLFSTIIVAETAAAMTLERKKRQ